MTFTYSSLSSTLLFFTGLYGSSLTSSQRVDFLALRALSDRQEYVQAMMSTRSSCVFLTNSLLSQPASR